jgi:Spy/CpxP family protein refolding chaperone
MWKTPRTLLVSGAALVVGLGVGAAVVPARAAQDPVLTPEQQSTLQQQADAFKACLEQQGVTLPAKPADGSRPEFSDEQKAALHSAFEACESQRPSRPALSDEQRAKLQAQMEQYRACLEAQGLTKPERPAPSADGTPPQRPQITDEQRAQIEAARAACADVAPNLGVGGVGPFGGPGGPGGFGHGFGGPGGRGGPGGQTPGGTGQTTT